MATVSKPRASVSNLLARRSCALCIVEVRGCNPNGDPDLDGRPRVLPDGRAWITDVSIKRKYRDMYEDHTSPVFIDLVELLNFDPEKFYCFESPGRGSPFTGTTERIKAIEWAYKLLEEEGEDAFLQRYHDVRLFGATALEPKKSKRGKGKKAEAEVDADENGEDAGERVRLKRTGVVTISPAVSIAPVHIIEASITKKASLREDIAEKEGVPDMAPMAMKRIDHGLFVFSLVVNPHVAAPTMTTEEDIRVFKDALPYIFRTSACCTRPADSIVFRHIWWTDHKNSLGTFNEMEFFSKLRPTLRGQGPSTSIDDYVIPTPDQVGLDCEVEDLCD